MFIRSVPRTMPITYTIPIILLSLPQELTWYSVHTQHVRVLTTQVYILTEFLPTSPLCVCMLSRLSHVQLFVTPWTVACQAPLSMGFPRQEYGRRLPCPPSGDLPNSGIKLADLVSCSNRQVLYHKHHLRSPTSPIGNI